MAGKLLSLVLAVLVVTGCGMRHHKREVLHENTVTVEQLRCRPTLSADQLHLEFDQVFSAEEEVVHHYYTNNLFLVLLDIPITILTLGNVSLTSRKKSDGRQHRIFHRPLDNGAPVSGILQVVEAGSGNVLLHRALAANVTDGRIGVPLGMPGAGCVLVSFEGETNTMGRQVAIAIEQVRACR